MLRKGIIRRKFVKISLVTILAVGVMLFAARAWVHQAARSRVFSDVNKLPKCRVALVLGCKVHKSGKLSTLLKDRVDKSIEIYRAGKVDKLLMSGDNRFSHYNEPRRMYDYAVRHGVPADDVVMDFAGRRTYDSVYRAKHIFGQNKFIIVSQGFHVDRAIFLAKHLGINAYAIKANTPKHRNNKAIIREIPACLGAIMDIYVRKPRPVLGKRKKLARKHFAMPLSTM